MSSKVAHLPRESIERARERLALMFPNPLVAELLTSIGGVAGGDAGGEGTVDVGGEGGQQDGGGCIRGSDGSGGGASFFSSSFAICDALSISNTASIAFLSAISALLHDDIVPDVPSVSILSAMAAMNPLPSAAISLGACTIMAVASFAEVASSPSTDTDASFHGRSLPLPSLTSHVPRDRWISRCGGTTARWCSPRSRLMFDHQSHPRWHAVADSLRPISSGNALSIVVVVRVGGGVGGVDLRIGCHARYESDTSSHALRVGRVGRSGIPHFLLITATWMPLITV
jgi:hypothetical protein